MECFHSHFATHFPPQYKHTWGLNTREHIRYTESNTRYISDYCNEKYVHQYYIHRHIRTRWLQYLTSRSKSVVAVLTTTTCPGALLPTGSLAAFVPPGSGCPLLSSAPWDFTMGDCSHVATLAPPMAPILHGVGILKNSNVFIVVFKL